MSTRALREKRAGIVAEARKIADAAKAESRSMNDEERGNFDKAMDDADALKEQINRLERLDETEGELAESRGTTAVSTADETSVEARSEAYRAWLLAGSNRAPSKDQVEVARRCGIDPYSKWLGTDAEDGVGNGRVQLVQRAQSVGTDSAGGFTAGDEMIRSLEVALKRFGGMREVAQVIRTTTGNSLPWPSLDDTAQKGERVSENTAVNEQDLTFAELILGAAKYSSKMVKVSVELIQDSSINIAEVIGTALGNRIGRITNEEFTTGTGAGDEPQGLFTAAADGFTQAALADGIDYPALVELEHSVDPSYRRNARWMFADSTLRSIKELVDLNDRPLWLPGIAVRAPDTILGYPYVINQDVDALTLANGASVAFGALDAYKVRDVRDISLLRLDERFAELHQVAFLAFSRHDGDYLNAGTDPVKLFRNAAT